ncbi:MAG: leucine-rich repeat protein [Ruminococcus sp.]|nr:leucine-rich repeat protein [Ruminococcus sp.]MDY4909667.1 leucine-rich repeat protein [Candidatus Fimenecus sp.]
MKKTKKIISLLLSVLMIITALPLTAVNSFAADVVKSGTTGECTWTLNGTVLTISGNGKMGKYYMDKYPSWGLSITKVVIENGVTSIGGMAFADCKSLTSVTIPDSVTSIGYRAFIGCTSLTSITIPESVTEIGEGTFWSCPSLTSVNIPDSVKSIGDHAFLSCTSLTSITIPDGVTSIGVGVFEGCTSLTSITIPDSVTRIGQSAFSDCTSLTSVTIPKSVKDIGSEAFGYYYDSVENKKTIDGFTVYGYQGSAAEKYAKDNGFEFSPMASTNELLLISVAKLPAKTEYYVGDTLDVTGLKITAKYTDNTEKVIDSDLTITGFNSSTAGTKVVTVDYKGKTATFNVKVVKPSITIENSSLSFDSIGSTKNITVTTTPIDQKIAWSSSNKNVATVSDGVVTAKGAGNATITATITVNGIEYSAECTVDVKLPTMSFPDVRSGDWYSDAVKYNFERGYITGYSNGTFGPANNIQRQDFALILARIAGADLSAYEGQNGGFSDVPTNTYYSAAVAWAKDRGIVTGYSTDNFGVGTYITREQISLILCRYLGGEASGDVDAILNAYPDGGNTSAWAKVGVAWAVENGIVGNAGYINPTGNAGRAEVAQIIYNMSNKGMI